MAGELNVRPLASVRQVAALPASVNRTISARSTPCLTAHKDLSARIIAIASLVSVPMASVEMEQSEMEPTALPIQIVLRGAVTETSVKKRPSA